MKKLAYYVLTCAIIASHPTIVRAADPDPDGVNQEKASFKIIRVTSADSDELDQEKIVQQSSAIGVTQEGECDGVLYIKQSRLHEIIFSAPGTHETEGFKDPYLNGFKCVKLNNEIGEEETYLLHGSFDQKHMSRFPKNDQLVSFSLTSLTPGIPAWGVSVELPSKKKSSKKKGSHRKHRSKGTKKVAS